mmetsp:Transcript_5675/g.4889  ORF Transcript_5675/g.4889 Transcript_5675/m.4889 type:complete len:312 (+) Transcript_5675:2-937(+)
MVMNGRYKKIVRIGEGSYGDVFKCIDYLPASEPRRLPEETAKLVHAVQNGDVAIDNDDFEDNFHDQFKDNDKYIKEETKKAEPEEGKEHFVAIKKTKWRRSDYLKHSFNFSTYKEIIHLQELKHENIVELIDIFYKNKNIYAVLEYMVGDLYQLIHKDKASLNPSQVKCIMHQVLTGLQFMHSNKLMHRDLKPGNLLIAKDGTIKYSDFGLARYYDKEELKGKENDSAQLTRNVCTRYYRAPEILYGSYDYSFSVDIWSTGCIMGELVLGDFLFKGENEIDQLNKIFEILGNAVEENWPGVSELPNYLEFD